MTPKQREEKEKALRAFLIARGFKEDKWGNFIREADGKAVRYKFTAVALRREVRCSHGWVRASSGYIRDIQIIDDKIHGMSRDGCQKETEDSIARKEENRRNFLDSL